MVQLVSIRTQAHGWPKLKSMGISCVSIVHFSDQQLHDSREKLPFIDQADGVLLSFRYKMIKPDDAI